ncbi:MAG: hypothetical protein SV375_00045 [Thermodesulfobacteriota bacterium]|nr:hypothetical protein [Thermodesulfobacteriota bacterium]
MARDLEDRERAEDLYIIDALTLEEVARATGIPERTIQKWSADDCWNEKKKEYQDTLKDIKRNTILLRKSLISKALQSLDPQDVYATVKMEFLAERKTRGPGGGGQGAEVDRPKIFLEDMEFVADALREIDPEGLKILARNFETIVKRFKEQNAQAT